MLDGACSSAVNDGSRFVIEPFTPNCRAVCDAAAHVVMGVSPNNSYFRVPRLTELLGWLCGTFARVDVVIPDSALVHTHLALGYGPDRARKKARDETSVLRSRVQRAWKAAGGLGKGHQVHLMSTLLGRPAYQRLLGQVRETLATGGELRATCLAMSRQVLSARLRETPTQAQLELAVDYLVAELPFFLDSAAIFGTTSSLCFYHRPVPLADLVFSGRTALRPSARQGYALIYPSGAEDVPPDARRATAGGAGC